MTTTTTALSFDERSKLISYISDAGDRIQEINEDIEELDVQSDYDVSAARKVKMLQSERQDLREQIASCRKQLQESA